jgi:hypothetical protein
MHPCLVEQNHQDAWGRAPANSECATDPDQHPAPAPKSTSAPNKQEANDGAVAHLTAAGSTPLPCLSGLPDQIVYSILHGGFEHSCLESSRDSLTHI